MYMRVQLTLPTTTTTSLQGLSLRTRIKSYIAQAPSTTTTLSLRASLSKIKLTLHLPVTTQCADACAPPGGWVREKREDLIDYPYIHTEYGEQQSTVASFFCASLVLSTFCSHASQTHGRRKSRHIVHEDETWRIYKSPLAS